MSKILHKRFFTVLVITFVSVLLTDCKRTVKDEDILGPEYRPAPEGFGIVTPLNTTDVSPNFRLSPFFIYFTADFTHEVSWTLTLTGETSGAVKVFTGLSGALDASNTKWDGGSSNEFFFLKNENVSAVLTFLGSALSESIALNIFNTKNYNGVIDGITYTIVEDFESTTMPASSPRYNLNSGFRDIGDDPVVNIPSSDVFLEGSKVYHFMARDKNSNGWLAGVTTDSLNVDSVFRSSTYSADDFYINLYVYGTGKENSSVQVKTYEVDNWSAAEYSKKYDQTKNDGWVYDIMIDWTGWKLISVPYSNFKRASDPILGGNGNGIRQHQNITGFALGLNSYPTSGFDVEAYVDMVVVTQGGPFKP